MSLILFEDEHLLVVNKPAGWNTHAPAPYAGEGLYDWLKHREPRWARLAILHRLDKETSGVLVFGKTPIANKSLTEQFTARDTTKTYRLLTARPLPSSELTAISTIVRAGEKYLSRPLLTGGERAETRFTPGRSGLFHEGLAQPVTGRTHQIRVHAAEHGFPILGDTFYGGRAAPRLFLHAESLQLRHPASGELLTFTAACPWREDGTLTGEGDLRRAILDPAQTDAFRMVHGAADDWPGLYVDKLGPHLLALSEGALSTAETAELNRLSTEAASWGVYHKSLNRHVRGASAAEASPQLLSGEAAPERFSIRENGLHFEMSFQEGYSVGLFLDQRDNRRRFLVNHVAAEFGPWSARLGSGAGVEVLNTFAYTCGFSVAAARAGARVTSLDLSKKYLDWGKRNFALNQLDPAGHDFIFGDTFDWMRRLAKKGRTYDAIVLDPPTFSQSKESGTWQAEKHYGRLITATLPLLKPGGVILASTNAAKLEPEKFLGQIVEATAEARRKILAQHYVPQPPDFPVHRAEPAYLKTVWLRLG